MTDDGSKRLGEWIVPTEDDFWRLALDEEARGLQEEGGLGGTLEETAKAFHDFYDARAVNGVVHTTLREVSAAVGATLASSALEVLVLSASSQWWDIKVRFCPTGRSRCASIAWAGDAGSSGARSLRSPESYFHWAARPPRA